MAVLKSARSKNKRRWHFKAERVHDFAFAADPDYVHQQIDVQNGPVVHLLFDPETANEANWELLKRIIYNATLTSWLPILAIPYPQFSIIQGGTAAWNTDVYHDFRRR